ncbi:NACHT and WD40 domain protein, partial [Reticulomyxa filosa]
IIQFVYGILKHQNHYIFSMDMKMLFGVLLFRYYKYTICSGSWDNTIRIWDIETTKQLSVFKGHKNFVMSVKYGSNELLNTILSGSEDKSVRLWDIRSGQQIQVLMDIKYCVNSSGNSNVICSGSDDNTIRFWDIRSNKNELYVIKGNAKIDGGILCLKFIGLKKKDKTKNVTYDLNLCYALKDLFYLTLFKKLKKLHSMFQELKSIINENILQFICYLNTILSIVAFHFNSILFF